MLGKRAADPIEVKLGALRYSVKSMSVIQSTPRLQRFDYMPRWQNCAPSFSRTVENS
jgi:hypothetical protein